MAVNDWLLASRFDIQSGTLRCHTFTGMIDIRPWGTEAGAWQTVRGSPWRPIQPEVNLGALEQVYLNLSCGPRTRSDRRAAVRFLLESWPAEARDLVGPFPSAHWQLLQFLNRCGERAEQLLSTNPALGFLAALDADAEELGRLLTLKRRELAARLGFPAAEAGVKALAKVAPGWISERFLAALRELYQAGNEATALLARLPRINPFLVRIISDARLHPLFSFNCLSQLGRIRPGVPHFDPLPRIEQRLEESRRLGLNPPHFDRLQDIDAPLHGPAAPPPPPPFVPVLVAPVAPIDGIEAILTIEELRAEGTEMHHCAGTQGYIQQVAEGRVFFYRMRHPERATICLRRRGASWRLDEVRGPCNRLVQGSTLTAIHIWLRGPQPERARRPRRAARPDRQMTLDFEGAVYL